MASDVKKKVTKNAGTTPVRTRVYPGGPLKRAPLRPLRLKLGESGPDSPKPPRVHIIEYAKNLYNVNLNVINIIPVSYTHLTLPTKRIV